MVKVKNSIGEALQKLVLATLSIQHILRNVVIVGMVFVGAMNMRSEHVGVQRRIKQFMFKDKRGKTN